jgi:putative glutamine amidotransferase
MRPIIILAGAPAYDRALRKPAVLLNKTYSAAVTAAGGAPLLALGDPKYAAAYCEAAHGLILTGAASYTPDSILRARLMSREAPARAAFDEAVYRAFKAARKPILGICLGHQMINMYEGGTLDRNFRLKGGVEHMLFPHIVNTKRGSVLRKLFGAAFTVNSRHNDKIGVPAASMTPTAFSPDGVIEAAEHKSLPIYTVQWHPERARGDHPSPLTGPDMTPLFEWFIGQTQNFI